MQAFRNLNGTVVEIQVDVGLDGQPILPPDTTVDPRPALLEGHYDTVVGKEWVQIPVPVPFSTFETLQTNALNALREYRDWYVDQPVLHNGVLFDADAKARNNLTQALVINQANGYLPPAWIAADNLPYLLTTAEELNALIADVQSAFSSRFFEMNTIRQQIMAATNEVELAAIEIPAISRTF